MSLRKAINDHCKSCSYDELDKGTWRYQVQHCGVSKCELYDVRPKTCAKTANFQVKTIEEGQGKGVSL